uniref:Diacylglycerol O-acyltransferase n=1 Tax=Bicosoecida sp. CB-2014 TaxID=1486930 RepID=A0A7S1CQD6_9STRA
MSPTLVYEPYYPRTKRFRISYFAEKVLLAISMMNACTVVMTSSVLPTFARMNQLAPWEALSELIVPILFLWILVFFIIFECMLNAIAELTYFADRQFYADWWNSTTFDEFARKWNKPVHEFLLRHVYIASMHDHDLSKPAATFATFLFSMLLHEMILATAFEMVQGWLFLFSLMQLPLIPLMRNPVFKGKRLGNLVFWWGTITGIPLVAVLYAKEYCRVNVCGGPAAAAHAA